MAFHQNPFFLMNIEPLKILKKGIIIRRGKSIAFPLRI